MKNIYGFGLALLVIAVLGVVWQNTQLQLARANPQTAAALILEMERRQGGPSWLWIVALVALFVLALALALTPLGRSAADVLKQKRLAEKQAKRRRLQDSRPPADVPRAGYIREVPVAPPDRQLTDGR